MFFGKNPIWLPLDFVNPQFLRNYLLDFFSFLKLECTSLEDSISEITSQSVCRFCRRRFWEILVKLVILARSCDKSKFQGSGARRLRCPNHCSKFQKFRCSGVLNLERQRNGGRRRRRKKNSSKTNRGPSPVG